MSRKKKNTSYENGSATGAGGNAAESSSFLRVGVVPDSTTVIIGEKASGAGILLFAFFVFAIVCLVLFGISWLVFGGFNLFAMIVSVLLAILAVMTVHIAQQWEKVVILRLGKMNRIEGPGLFFTVPFIEHVTMRVDLRVRATTFGAEETLTSDLVPLNVNAVLFWLVWDPNAACTEVGDFTLAVDLAAQTALRDAIGRAGAAEVAIRRDQLDRELKKVLEEKVAPWGVTILSVEIRDILMPKELQDVMSLEAQADQRRKARITLMEAEQDICEMLEEMGDTYTRNEAAMRLRAMHLLYESIRETGGTVVVPSSFSEGFGDVLPDSLQSVLTKAGQ